MFKTGDVKHVVVFFFCPTFTADVLNSACAYQTPGLLLRATETVPPSWEQIAWEEGGEDDEELLYFNPPRSSGRSQEA